MLILALLLLQPAFAHAQTIQEPVLTAPQDARAQHLYTEVRCVVCQGEDIADSDAAIAADMRAQIRAAIAHGQSDATIRKSLLDHYGDYVLFRPRWSKGNLVLWLLPPLIVLGGLVWLWRRARKPEKSESYALDAAEEKKLRDILQDGG